MVRLLFIKMDLTNLQIEGISKSKYNLKNYEFSNRKILGNRRLIHVSIPDGTLENRLHYCYDIKTINKTTINLTCHQRGQTGKQCPAILSCTVPFKTVEKVLDGEKKSRTKRWTFCDKTTDEELEDPNNYKLYHNCSKACATKGCLSGHTCLPRTIAQKPKRDFRAFVRRRIEEYPNFPTADLWKTSLLHFNLRKTRPSLCRIGHRLLIMTYFIFYQNCTLMKLETSFHPFQSL